MLHSLGFDNTDISLLESDLVKCVRIDSFKASDRLINMLIIKSVVQHFDQHINIFHSNQWDKSESQG